MYVYVHLFIVLIVCQKDFQGTVVNPHCVTFWGYIFTCLNYNFITIMFHGISYSLYCISVAYEYSFCSSINVSNLFSLMWWKLFDVVHFIFFGERKEKQEETVYTTWRMADTETSGNTPGWAIRELLRETGVAEWDPRVVNQLLEFQHSEWWDVCVVYVYLFCMYMFLVLYMSIYFIVHVCCVFQFVLCLYVSAKLL